MISKELQQKLDIYEQIYFGLDEPVPFKEDLVLYPVMVKDYYNFYSCLNCLTMDKNVKMVPMGELGQLQKVSNPEGIGQSYLAYLADRMVDPGTGPLITTQVLQMMELIFHVKRGFYCPKCHHEVRYEDALKDLDKEIQDAKEKAQKLYIDTLEARESELNITIEDKQIPEDFLNQIIQKTKMEYFQKMLICPECEETMQDLISMQERDGYKVLRIKDTEITPMEFDELKAIVPRQNILDYDGDKYVDPDLKEELEIKAKLQNSDYTSPTLEKQMACVAIGTGYDFEYLRNVSMRRLSVLLRLIDKKETYYAQLQASMSGMVKFPEGSIKHWIFTDDKKNIKDELIDADAFEKRFDQVT